MNKEKYNKARSFSFLISGPGPNPLDLVHDCYVKWREKHGKDFFEETPTLMYKVMRNHYISELRHGRKFTWRGIPDHFKLLHLNDVYEDGEPVYELAAPNSTDDLVIVNELKDALTKKIAKVDKLGGRLVSVLNIISDGYDYKQVQKEFNVGRTTASTEIKIIREQLSLLVEK